MTATAERVADVYQPLALPLLVFVTPTTILRHREVKSR